jgi:hypothetical protein
VEQPPVDLLRRFDSNKVKAWQVSTRINSMRNNDPSLIEPVEDGEAAPAGRNGLSSDGDVRRKLERIHDNRALKCDVEGIDFLRKSIR